MNAAEQAETSVPALTPPGNQSNVPRDPELRIKIMNSPLMQFFRKALGRETALHPIEQGLARQWVKKRLALIYPELKNDPKALESAYRTLSLEPRLGTEDGDRAAYFEMTFPG